MFSSVFHQPFSDVLIPLLDLLGTIAFAVNGAMAAIRRRTDLFGVLVLAFAAANSGGIMRDVLLGAAPPAGIRDLRYLSASVLAGLAAFFWYERISRFRHAMLLMDAMGLALFAVAGAQKALAYQLSPIMAAMMGVLTAVGGGIVRDLLLNDIPWVLRREIYAVAALLGSGIAVFAHQLSVPSALAALIGAVCCFGLRLLAIVYDWHLPVALYAERDITPKR